MRVSDRGVLRVWKGEVEPRDIGEKVTRSLKMALDRFRSCRGLTVSCVEQRGDSRVLVMHDGVTESILAQDLAARIAVESSVQELESSCSACVYEF